MKVVYTFQARQDLKNIYAYITYTLLAPEAAEKLINEIIQNVNTLDSMPERNPLYRDEPWYSRGVRYLPVRKYLVFYTVYAKDDTIFVSRILYGGRDVSKQLDYGPGAPFYFYRAPPAFLKPCASADL